MKAIELKAVLHRSNPSVVRQFTMPADISAGQMGNALLLLTGLEEQGCLHMWSLKTEIKEELAVREIFEPGEVVFFELAKPGGRTGGSAGGKNQGDASRESLLFRIVALGEKEQEEPYPVLTHWRGDNLPDGVFDVAVINRYQIWRSKGDYGLYREEFRKFVGEDYSFSPQTASRKLKKMFAVGDSEANPVLIDLDYENAYKIQDVLSDMTIQELKNIASEEKFRLPSGLRKEPLAAHLAKALTDAAVFDRCMECLTAGEYEIFKAICTGKDLSRFAADAVDHVAGVFYGCGFMDTYYGYEYGSGHRINQLADYIGEYEHEYSEDDITVAEELLMLYEEWLEAGKEEGFLRKAKAYTTIMGYIRLYGFVEKKDWMQQAHRLLEGTYTGDELTAIWQEYAQYCRRKRSRTVGQYFASVLYAREDIDETSFPSILDYMRNTAHYRPEFEELKRIETEGLHFSESDTYLLETFLRQESRMYREEYREIVNLSYRCIRNGIEINKLTDHLANTYYIRDKRTLNGLTAILERLRPSVRQIRLGGYTEQEMRTVTQKNTVTVRKAEKRIYPNDPCPCGSGKKYKNCHGKNR